MPSLPPRASHLLTPRHLPATSHQPLTTHHLPLTTYHSPLAAPSQAFWSGMSDVGLGTRRDGDLARLQVH